MSHAAPPQQAENFSTKFSDEELSSARSQVGRAFALIGAVSENGNPVCLQCGTDRKGKVKLFDDGGWHCFKCAAHGDAIGLLMASGWSFPAAVGDLLGRTVKRPKNVTSVERVPSSTASFTATVDVEVYQALLDAGSVPAAIEFYSRFCIASDAVRESGAVLVADATRAAAKLARQFGIDRLVASGLAYTSDRGTRLLVNDQYPVVEPHRRPDGAPTGLQFRASASQAEKVAAHKRGEGPYVPKFLSLKGAGRDHLLGCGLPRVAKLSPGTKVRVCEGFKDLLAARSMGWEAYALPGAGAIPPESALEVLRRHKVVLMFDGDDAGVAGAERLHEQFRDAGCTVLRAKLPNGMDIADMLARSSTQRR